MSQLLLFSIKHHLQPFPERQTTDFRICLLRFGAFTPLNPLPSHTHTHTLLPPQPRGHVDKWQAGRGSEKRGSDLHFHWLLQVRTDATANSSHKRETNFCRQTSANFRYASLLQAQHTHVHPQTQTYTCTTHNIKSNKMLFVTCSEYNSEMLNYKHLTNNVVLRKIPQNKKLQKN